MIDLANSIGAGWRAIDSLPTTLSKGWRKELELKTGFLHDLFHWAERITGCRLESIKVRGAWRA